MTDDQRPLSDSRPAQGQVHRLGARLWVGGFAQGADRARQTGGSKTDAWRRMRRPPRITIRQIIGMPCWRCRRRTNFPGQATNGNGISPDVKSQGQWIHLIKTDSCESCHQLGNQYTRTIPAMFSDLDPAQAWMRRLQSGQAGSAMMGGLSQLGPQASHRAVWRLDHPDREGRVACGGASTAAGHRAQRGDHSMGLGRSESLSARRDLHRQAQSKRKRQRPDLRIARGEPRLFAGARSRAQHDQPAEGSLSRSGYARAAEAAEASPVWGDEAIWDSHTTVHNPMFDERGRLWFTARIRANDNPAFCKAGSSLLRRSSLPCRIPAANWRCTIQRRNKSR